MQFPFPSLWNPDAQKIGTDEATQLPFPSLANPLGHTVTDGGELGETNTHPPYPSVVYPDAQDVKTVSLGTHRILLLHHLYILMGKLMVLKQNQEHRIHFHYYDILNCKSLVLYLEHNFHIHLFFILKGS